MCWRLSLAASHTSRGLHSLGCQENSSSADQSILFLKNSFLFYRTLLKKLGASVRLTVKPNGETVAGEVRIVKKIYPVSVICIWGFVYSG